MQELTRTDDPAGGARRPEDNVGLLVERANAGDLDGVVALYEPNAVIAHPPGGITRGHAAIREVWAKVLACTPRLSVGPPMPTIVHDDLALTITSPEDMMSTRAQVLRRQPNGRWLRVIDQPPFGAIPAPTRFGREDR
jgi:ketosteroid isomerase-like protein